MIPRWIDIVRYLQTVLNDFRFILWDHVLSGFNIDIMLTFMTVIYFIYLFLRGLRKVQKIFAILNISLDVNFLICVSQKMHLG